MPNLEKGIVAFQAQDYSNAFKILQPIAEQGNAEAQCILGNMYDLGLFVDANETKAIYWYLQGAKQGHIIAQNNLGNLYCNQGQIEEAEKWLLQSAQQGFLLAQVTLANLYITSAKVLKNQVEVHKNELKASEWYRKAADKGFPIACHQLGEIYGKGANKDETEALKWYQKAAEQEYQPSQEFLAQAYLEGLIGLPKDIEKAQYWLKKAKANKQ